MMEISQDGCSSNGEDESHESEIASEMDKKRKQNTSNGASKMKKVKYDVIPEYKTETKAKKDFCKQPTLEELTTLKETENLYNSGLFRLQIEELISAVKIKEKHKNRFTSWFHSFKNVVNSLPEFDSILLSSIKSPHKSKLNSEKLSEMEKLLLELSKYKTNLKCDNDLAIKFINPKRIKTFGLHKLDALPGPTFQVNINIEMPKACFQAKDYLNNRYFVKRYYYLLYITSALKKSELCSKIEFVHHQEISLLPIIQIVPNHSEKTLIKIYATPEEDHFKPARFLPNKNNVKENTFNDDFYDVDLEIMKWTQTLSYNSAILHDVTLTLNNSYFEESLKGYGNIQEGIKILLVWAKQRELLSTCASLTSELIVCVILYLMKQRRINKYMSSYQVIRSFWDFLIKNDLTKNPIAICDNVTGETFVEFQNNYDVVVLDRSGCYNLTSHLHENFYRKIVSESRLAFNLLDSGGIDAFYSLFITKLPIALQYDVIIRVKSTDCFKNIYESTKEQDRGKYLGNYKGLIMKYVLQILNRGFGERASHIVPYFPKNGAWKLNESCDSVFNSILLGINLNPENAFNFIQKGPALNDPSEKEFREFWGRLSSDRRFRDGTVCVALYFETKTIKDKRDIIVQITDYLVKEKLNLEYDLHCNETEELLVNSRISASYPFGTNEETSLKITQASDDLGKKLRDLNMSLAITGVQGISGVFSYTDIFPPIPTTYLGGKTVTKSVGQNILLNEKKINVVPKYVQPVECVLQLERSSKWPSDVKAIQNMIIAFYLEIAKLLFKKHNIICSVKRDFLDVFYEGIVFRYRLYVPREVSLLKKEVTLDGVVSYKDTADSIELEKKLDILPRVVGALKGLQSQHPSYGPSTALIKRWLSSHLINDYLFPDIVVDLLNASLYLNNLAFLPPQIPQIAFFRFLKFFSELQWDLHPVILNFNETMTKEEISEVEATIEKNRTAYPLLYIIMPYDNKESVFTKSAPTREVLCRVKSLGMASLNLFENMITAQNLFSLKDLFIPNFDGYNVLIHLKPLLNPRRHEQIRINETESKLILKKYDPKESTQMPVIDFNPVQIYLKELRDNFGEFATFFHDTYGGGVIGVLWKPSALDVKDFKVSYVYGRKLVEDKLVLNIDGLIEDFYILGKDVVRLIEKK